MTPADFIPAGIAIALGVLGWLIARSPPPTVGMRVGGPTSEALRQVPDPGCQERLRVVIGRRVEAGEDGSPSASNGVRGDNDGLPPRAA